MSHSSPPSQWQNLLRHLGTWQGSFTQLSTSGATLEDPPTQVVLQGLNENQTIRQTNVYFSQKEGESDQTRVVEYSSLSRSILLFEDGSFSQGSIQFSPVSEFGAEFGFVRGDRRLRLVELFRPSEGSSPLASLTLIREQRQGTQAPERPALTVAMLLGEWVGEAQILYPDLQPPQTYSTRLVIEQTGERLSQHLTTPNLDITSSAIIQGDRLLFDQSGVAVQVLLLPDGASCNTPLVIPRGRPFFLEAGWLIEPNLRLRLIRSYDAQGGWSSLTLVTERKN